MKGDVHPTIVVVGVLALVALLSTVLWWYVLRAPTPRTCTCPCPCPAETPYPEAR